MRSDLKTPVVKLLDAYQKDAKEVLEEALSLDFETVVVVGVKKDKTVHFTKSANTDMLQIMGSLEAVKLYIWGNWE